MANWQVIEGDCLTSLRALGDQTINTCVTSPPYFGLRDYGVAGQVGLEGTPEAFTAKLVDVFREVRRVLKDDGTLWLNLGDSYAGSGARSSNPGGKTPKQVTNRGSYVGDCAAPVVPPGCKPKDLIGIPWMVAFALRADGWYLRSDIIWHKPNPMPESVTDRPTKAHEYIFLLSKSERYYYDHEAVLEPLATELHAPGNKWHPSKVSGPNDRGGHSQWDDTSRTWGNPKGRNRRTVWTVTTKPFKGAHFATFPPDLIKPCILAGCPEGGTVLDPFNGAGTTGVVSLRNGRNYIGLELNPEYVTMSTSRITATVSQPNLLRAV